MLDFAHGDLYNYLNGFSGALTRDTFCRLLSVFFVFKFMWITSCVCFIILHVLLIPEVNP